MLTNKTCIVVGAGASAELGLPAGDGLKVKIAEYLRPDRRSTQPFSNSIFYAIAGFFEQSKGGATNVDMRNMIEVADDIISAMPLAPSIDNFLDAHRDDERIVALGKIAIAYSILNAEQGSNLRYEDEAGSLILPQQGAFLQS